MKQLFAVGPLNVVRPTAAIRTADGYRKCVDVELAEIDGIPTEQPMEPR